MAGSLEADLVDPLVVTWNALGDPAPVVNSGPVARCGRCNQEQSLKLLREILSSNFTGWEQVDPASLGLCSMCAWAYQETLLRTNAIHINRETASWAGMDTLVSLLSQPLSSQDSIVLPMRGQKHLLPSAKWASITSDSGTFPWNAEAAQLLTTMLLARKAGAKKSDYEKEAPSLLVVETAGVISFEWWKIFQRWKGTPHFDVSQYLAVGVTNK